MGNSKSRWLLYVGLHRDLFPYDDVFGRRSESQAFCGSVCLNDEQNPSLTGNAIKCRCLDLGKAMDEKRWMRV